jgi:hypothetical protein
VQQFFMYPPGRSLLRETTMEREVGDSGFDESADRILEEMGICEETPPSDLTYDVGSNFSARLLSSIESDPSLVYDFADAVLEIFVEMFPRDPDTETVEVQTYFWAPWVSKLLTGRGLTIPQIATVAGVSTGHVYRLMGRGLRIMYVEVNPPARRGVNRRFTGVDGRQTHLLPDPTGLTERPWPTGAEEYRPFIRGLMAGLEARLGDADLKAKLEPFVMTALSAILTDPKLGDVFDGAVQAIQRIAQTLRERVLKSLAEKDRATQLACAMCELSSQKELVFDALAEAATHLTVRKPALTGVHRT